jgi:hypothetical protein
MYPHFPRGRNTLKYIWRVAAGRDPDRDIGGLNPAVSQRNLSVLQKMIFSSGGRIRWAAVRISGLARASRNRSAQELTNLNCRGRTQIVRLALLGFQSSKIQALCCV